MNGGRRSEMEHLSDADLNPKVPLFLQFRAVFLKNLTLMIRQKKSLILFCILSILLMIVPPIVLNLVNPSDSGYGFDPEEMQYFSGTDYISSRWAYGGLSYYYVTDHTGQFGTLPRSRSELNSHLYDGSFLGQLFQFPYRYYYQAESWCKQSPGFTESQTFSVPWTESYGSAKELVAAFRQASKMCWDTQPNYGMEVNALQYKDRSKKYELDVMVYGQTQDWYDRMTIPLRAAMLGHALNYSYPEYIVENPGTVNSNYDTPQVVVLRYDLLPPNKAVPRFSNGFGLTFYWIFSMLVLSFLTPMLTQRLVLERQDGLVDVSMMMGLSRWAHWLGHLTLDFALYLVVYILILIVAASSRANIALAMLSPWVILPSLFFGVTSVATAYLISFAFRSPRTCLIASYVYALVQFAIVAVFNMLLAPPTQNLPGYLLWWPPISFFRITYVGFMNYAMPSSSTALLPVLRTSILCLIFETIAVIVIVVILDRIAPTKLGNRGTTLNMLTDFIMNTWRKCRAKRAKKDRYETMEEDDESEPLATQRAFTDARVLEEETAVAKGAIDDAIMVINQVSKVYAEGVKRFTAVSKVSFALREGDCFGLLGPNGAGKSTLVAIMSGILTATSGSVTVSKARDRCAIGLCPQDDIFYSDLTVEEHLLYYSRLKGKAAGEDQASVNQILADVSMENERRLQASSLSGGQKRRLSVASALCGDPMVVFLDEPSSSLDPGSRIGLWEIVQSVSKNRCTLLTTHSMEEAEVLCNRIGIIKDGKMVCLGSSSQLKQSYGEGYKLMASLAHGAAIEPVIEAVKVVAPEARLISQKHGHYQIHLGKEALLSSVTEVMEHQKKPLKINVWSLSRNGLDEVFLRIVEDRSQKDYGTAIDDDSILAVDESDEV